ncbi:MFS transporter [Allostreptomyces psammosilenae]|uniref:EmrB/QacA subfamily drug resistance transporter n=1 Tax=Allostreptomyces psammosilenae TaxID=1892865 RepID=A0A853A051_9ACTN|nr:MFS transporter [Allostreptomyces psammosilenae]NYI07956.1 EmrB/QacA subfamily drug resistance transporter [Allostreptomyces psammosilenae]
MDQASTPDPPPATGPAVRMGTPRGRRVLLVTVLGSGMAMLDATVVGIAVPVIGREFEADVGALQWVVNAYTLVLSGLLLLGGSLGDRLGRRRIFLQGTAAFAVASALCALAPNAPVLIAGRALQGVGAALLVPGSLALLEASFVREHRARAIGAWSGLGGVATAAGPFIGGWLIDAASWRLIFLINLPLAAAVWFVGLRHVPESRAPGVHGRLDVVGAAVITGGLGLLTYALIAGEGRGWSSWPIVGALVLGLGLLVAFVFWEGRTASPLLPLSIFSSRQLTAANVVTFVVYGALGAAVFLLPVVLQGSAGYSPLASGVALLPLTVLMLLLSSASGELATRIGPRAQMAVGPVVAAVGIALFVRIDTVGDYPTQVLPGAVVLGLGLAITVAPLTATALGSAPPEHAGIASAVNNDVARAAGLLAVAVVPPVSGITADAYLRPEVLLAGFRVAMLVCAVACAVGGVLAALLIRNPPRRPGPDGTAGAEAEVGAGAGARKGDGGEREDGDHPSPCFHCGLDAPPPTPTAPPPTPGPPDQPPPRR